MKNFFEEIEKLHIQYKAIENLDGYQGMLTKQEVKRVKEEIKKRVVDVVETQIYKFRT